MTPFMKFWRALNEAMATRGEDEVLHADARHLFELFGNAEAAADHETILRTEARMAA